jgi:hypothetical protein
VLSIVSRSASTASDVYPPVLEIMIYRRNRAIDKGREEDRASANGYRGRLLTRDEKFKQDTCRFRRWYSDQVDPVDGLPKKISANFR